MYTHQRAGGMALAGAAAGLLASPFGILSLSNEWHMGHHREPLGMEGAVSGGYLALGAVVAGVITLIYCLAITDTKQALRQAFCAVVLGGSVGGAHDLFYSLANSSSAIDLTSWQHVLFGILTWPVLFCLVLAVAIGVATDPTVPHVKKSFLFGIGTALATEIAHRYAGRFILMFFIGKLFGSASNPSGMRDAAYTVTWMYALTEFLAIGAGIGFMFGLVEVPIHKRRMPERSPNGPRLIDPFGVVIDLGPGENLVGRDPASAVHLPYDQRISRQHARILIGPNFATLHDLGSRNGTLINGQPLTDQSELHDGDKVQFGSTDLLFRCS